jgi:hypothetical protein
VGSEEKKESPQASSSETRTAPDSAADVQGIPEPAEEDGGASESAPGDTASTLRLDPEESGGGVSVWVFIAAAGGVLALLFLFRRRLRGLLPR